MGVNLITAEIDDIANSVENLSKKYPRHASQLTRLAASLDTVSNELDSDERTSGLDPESGFADDGDFPDDRVDHNLNRGESSTDFDRRMGDIDAAGGLGHDFDDDVPDHELGSDDDLGMLDDNDPLRRKFSSRKSSRRRVAVSPEDGDDGEDFWGPEADYQDSFEWNPDREHRAPVGQKSLSIAINKQPKDILGDLDFAQSTSGKDKHRILVQANKRRKQASWPFADLSPQALEKMARQGQWDQVRRAASMALSEKGVRQAATEKLSDDMDVDLGRFGAEDNLSTADLAESGDEAIGKPIDADQEGGTLQFFGTYAQNDQDDGPDSGHHRRNTPAPNRTRASRARAFLERIADRPVKPEVKDPEDLLSDEPGDRVERDQPLGGLSGQYKGRKSSRAGRRSPRQVEAKVYRPTHVPKEMHGFWHKTATKLASKGNLLLSSGKVNYYEIDDKYRDGLHYFAKKASQTLKGRVASKQAYLKTPSKVNVYRPGHVPPELAPYWTGAATYLGEKNRLVTSSRKVDYDGITRQYVRLLNAVASVPSE